MTARAGICLAVAAALIGLPPVFAQDKKVTHYEPNKRNKVGVETCMKNEVLQGAWCIRKCQEGFRLDLKSSPPLCIATSPNARFVPDQPQFHTPDKPVPKNYDKGA
jgi:hypothetical protein